MAYDYVTVDGAALHDVVAGVAMGSEWEGLTGIPEIRGTVFDRSEGDGVIEPANQYLGPRMVRERLAVWGSTIATAWDAWQVLNLTLLKSVRDPQLIQFRPQGHSTADLQVTGRLVSASYPALVAGEMGPFYESELIWRCADPLIYSQASNLSSASAPAVSSTGMPLPVIFPIPFGVTASGGSVIITAGGNAPSWPTVTVNGPINGPVIFNATQGLGLYFEGVSLAVGESLVVVMNPAAPRSATVAGVNKLGGLRYADSNFWALTPGVAETIQFWGIGLGYGGTTTMDVAWRDAYIS